MKKYKLGIVLSGGGVRGFAHIGVLKKLEENGIIPDIISGASMGAIVGVFYCSGFSANKMQKLLKNKKLSRAVKWNISRRGLMNHGLLESMLKRYIVKDSFEELKIPLAVSVTNLTKGENQIHSKGKLFDYVIASATIPILFKPRYIKGDVFVDGGLTDNLPVSAIKKDCEYVLGIHVNHMNNDRKKFNNFRDIGERCFRIAVYKTVRKGMKKCDWVIDPPKTRDYSSFEFRKFDELIDIGYKATTNKMIKEIKRNLKPIDKK